jgi:hypothetical protein
MTSLSVELEEAFEDVLFAVELESVLEGFIVIETEA